MTHLFRSGRKEGWTWLPALFVCASIVFLGHSCERQQEQTSASVPDAELIARGRDSFQQLCANCHGADADGFGAAVGDVQTLPADLTNLTLRNDGVFPEQWIAGTIDGRVSVEAHGPREMPVWGNVFSDEEAPERIDELVAYIQSVQRTE